MHELYSLMICMDILHVLIMISHLALLMHHYLFISLSSTTEKLPYKSSVLPARIRACALLCVCYLSACPTIRQSVSLPRCLSDVFFVCLTVHLSLNLSFYVFLLVRQSAHLPLSVSLFTFQSVHLPNCWQLSVAQVATACLAIAT